MTQRKSDSQTSEGLPRPLEGRRVLVVEDDSDTRHMLKFLLEQTGASVVVAASVPSALDEFAAQRPDVILADIAMPGLNGYALIAEVRRRDIELGGRTKAIAVTAYSTRQDQELAATSGFDGYVTKPFDPDALVQTIVDLLQR